MRLLHYILHTWTAQSMCAVQVSARHIDAHKEVPLQLLRAASLARQASLSCSQRDGMPTWQDVEGFAELPRCVQLVRNEEAAAVAPHVLRQPEHHRAYPAARSIQRSLSKTFAEVSIHFPGGTTLLMGEDRPSFAL